MSNRREFTKAVKVEIIKRARVNAVIRCEKCAVDVRGSWHIDHIDPDAMQIDKSEPLTAEEGQLLCLPCHDEKTRKDVADIAKAKRREAAHLGARRPRQPMKGGGTLKGPSRKHEGRAALPPRSLFR